MFHEMDRGPASLRAKGKNRRAVFARSGECRGQLERAAAQLYLDPLAPAPGVSVFLTLDPGASSRWVCAQIGDLVAFQRPASVCLIEVDPTGPSLRERLGLMESRGGRSIFSDASLDLSQLPAQVPNSDLWLLTVGSSGRISNRLPANRLPDQIDRIRRRFDFILIDAPCFESSSLMFELARLADGAVLVLQPGTRRQRALHRKQEFEAAGVKMLGIILADPSFPMPETISAQA
jgi:Mrp family chromosome partitioning ATPase